MNYLILLIAFFALPYSLWVFYLAVMSLKRGKDAGTLTFWGRFFGYPVLFFGLALDFVTNLIFMSVLLLELPREGTVTSRLKRHNAANGGWRKAIAVWAEQLLDQFDPSGNHI